MIWGTPHFHKNQTYPRNISSLRPRQQEMRSQNLRLACSRLYVLLKKSLFYVYIVVYSMWYTVYIYISYQYMICIFLFVDPILRRYSWVCPKMKYPSVFPTIRRSKLQDLGCCRKFSGEPNCLLSWAIWDKPPASDGACAPDSWSYPSILNGLNGL